MKAKEKGPLYWVMCEIHLEYEWLAVLGQVDGLAFRLMKNAQIFAWRQWKIWLVVFFYLESIHHVLFLENWFAVRVKLTAAGALSTLPTHNPIPRRRMQTTYRRV